MKVGQAGPPVPGFVAPYLPLSIDHTNVEDFSETGDDNSTDRDYGAVGAGASINLRDRWSGYVDFDALVGYSDLQTYTAALGIRKEL